MNNLRAINNESWKTVKLSDCVDILDSQRIPVNSDERSRQLGKVPYYGATGQVGWIDKHIFDEELVLLGEDGAPFLDKSKPIAYIINGKSWVNNHAHVLRGKTGVADNWFIKYFLDSFDFSDYVAGTTRLKLTQTLMRSIPISLPTLNEQQEISAWIKEIIQNTNTNREKILNARQLLAKFRQVILSAAVTGKLTEDWRETTNTDKWTSYTLLEVCEVITDGDHQAPPKANSGIPFLVISDINDGVLNLNTKRHVPDEYYKALKETKRPKRGDVLYSVVGSFGIPVLVEVDDKFVFQRHIALLRPNNKILSKYLYYIMKSREVYKQASEVATGTAQMTVPLTGLRKIEIELPTMQEQEEILRRIDQYFNLAKKVESQIANAEAKVSKLTQAVLAKIFSNEGLSI